MQKVPTTIITGFLGVGKTTTILNLLNNKPNDESWAVLVNEFGEIGIDGAILDDSGAMIKEIAGGCICCSANLPMSVGINALLRQKPDRLLIEPTGLGHPKQVVATLTSQQYSDYVDLKATIALVDPRHLSEERYLTNSNFNEQLESAEIVIGNKIDQCQPNDLENFHHWLEQQTPSKLGSYLTEQGDIDLMLLDIARNENGPSSNIENHHHEHAAMEPQFELPPGQAYVRKENAGQGYFSCGWLFGAEIKFDFDALFTLFSSLSAERIKAVINTQQGCYAFNVSNGVVSVNELSLSGYESRLEVINGEQLAWEELESILLEIGDIDGISG